MTVDTNVYALAKLWLIQAGIDNTIDFERLAQKIQDVIEDHMADLENELVESNGQDHLRRSL